MFEVRKLQALLLALILSTIHRPAAADPRTGVWVQSELSEQFMRTLTKSQCMTKTVATLKAGCSTDACTKNLAGVTGDCVSWGHGSDEAFCATYDREYIASYCATNELDARSCTFLQIGKLTFCKPPSKR